MWERLLGATLAAAPRPVSAGRRDVDARLWTGFLVFAGRCVAACAMAVDGVCVLRREELARELFGGAMGCVLVWKSHALRNAVGVWPFSAVRGLLLRDFGVAACVMAVNLACGASSAVLAREPLDGTMRSTPSKVGSFSATLPASNGPFPRDFEATDAIIEVGGREALGGEHARPPFVAAMGLWGKTISYPAAHWPRRGGVGSWSATWWRPRWLWMLVGARVALSMCANPSALLVVV